MPTLEIILIFDNADDVEIIALLFDYCFFLKIREILRNTPAQMVSWIFDILHSETPYSNFYSLKRTFLCFIWLLG
ncbi:hypothetical protein BpHYR1_015603 [Brachionus plicatilis]|uniref:Uncharacterized protein n=1 Tax=Brachionus plicatilis TaxID=10195 RepID=A0A3M7PRW5_BRAPC|nr:hypothetical protein BpHYR1_015603 [Brachionus plicatilis]